MPCFPPYGNRVGGTVSTTNSCTLLRGAASQRRRSPSLAMTAASKPRIRLMTWPVSGARSSRSVGAASRPCARRSFTGSAATWRTKLRCWPTSKTVVRAPGHRPQRRKPWASRAQSGVEPTTKATRRTAGGRCRTRVAENVPHTRLSNGRSVDDRRHGYRPPRNHSTECVSKQDRVHKKSRLLLDTRGEPMGRHELLTDAERDQLIRKGRPTTPLIERP